MVVAIVAEVKCDPMAVDLQFDNRFPGILLKTADLSAKNAKTYDRWCAFSEYLRVSIDNLARHKESIPQYTAYSRLIPDELLKIAFDDKKPVVDFCQQEAKSLENTMKLEAAAKSLESLITEIEYTIHDCTYMIDAMRDSSKGMLEGIKTVAEKAYKEGKLTTKEVADSYYGMLRDMVPTQS